MTVIRIPAVASRLSAIQREAGTPQPAKSGFMYRVVTRARSLSPSGRADKARRQMAALRARLGW